MFGISRDSSSTAVDCYPPPLLPGDKLYDHPLYDVCDCYFNTLAAALSVSIRHVVAYLPDQVAARLPFYEVVIPVVSTLLRSERALFLVVTQNSRIRFQDLF